MSEVIVNSIIKKPKSNVLAASRGITLYYSNNTNPVINSGIPLYVKDFLLGFSEHCEGVMDLIRNGVTPTVHVNSGFAQLFTLPADFHTSITETLCSRLMIIEEIFQLEDPLVIHNFIATKSDLVEALIYCYSSIYKYFGNTKPTLKLIKDNEIPEWETLSISIPVEFDEKSFLNLSYIISEWLVFQSKDIKSLLNITVG